MCTVTGFKNEEAETEEGRRKMRKKSLKSWKARHISLRKKTYCINFDQNHFLEAEGFIIAPKETIRDAYSCDLFYASARFEKFIQNE